MWAGVLGIVGFILSMLGYTGLDPTAQASFTDAIITFTKDISAILAPILAIISFFKPKS